MIDRKTIDGMMPSFADTTVNFLNLQSLHPNTYTGAFFELDSLKGHSAVLNWSNHYVGWEANKSDYFVNACISLEKMYLEKVDLFVKTYLTAEFNLHRHSCVHVK